MNKAYADVLPEALSRGAVSGVGERARAVGLQALGRLGTSVVEREGHGVRATMEEKEVSKLWTHKFCETSLTRGDDRWPAGPRG